MWHFNLAHIFKEVVERGPERVALKFPERDYSYRELDLRSDTIAALFLHRRLGPHDVAIITSKKTFETFATLVACWKVGVTHCFVDRLSPAERLKKILQTCQPKIIVADAELRQRLDPGLEIPIVDLQDLNGPAVPGSLSFSRIPSNTVAYIMFTSGSTGTPKGVAITHEQMIRFAHWGESEYGIQPEDVFSGLNSLFFDNSVFDLAMSLLHGASLVPISREDFKNTKAVLEHLEHKGVNTWFSVPSLLVYFLNLRAFQAHNLSQMKRFIFGGEGFPKILLKQLHDLFGERASLFNVYGPTECTCICSSYLVTERDFNAENMQTLSPLGDLAENFEHYILDETGKILGEDAIGELFLGGSNVSPGYYNDPAQSLGKFVQNPTHGRYRDIFYRTGDLVRRSAHDKLLYFCGRADDQIKFMGYRIELSEIEAAVATIAQVEEMAVTFGQKDGVAEITCFLRGTVDKSVLKQALQKVLPSYMIPRKFVYLEFLPKNANGKVDKKKLAREHYDSTRPA